MNNCYQKSTRLFVIGGTEISSSESITQGDPVAIFVYAIAIIPLILHTANTLEEKSLNAKVTGYADDIFGAGKLDGLKQMWNTMVSNTMAQNTDIIPKHQRHG